MKKMTQKRIRNDLAFINLDKPVGMTSFDCIRKLRRILGIKKMGHLGTLDPGASGVLPLALGKATKLIPYVNGGRKKYRTIIKLGIVTDTNDMQGKIISSCDPPVFPMKKIQDILEDFRGEIEQTPPAVSAIKIKGQRAYDLVRKGEVPDIKSRIVNVFSIDIPEYNHPDISVYMEVSGGTYVRSIARDIGEKLGCGASVAELVRTYSEPFGIENSHSIEAISESFMSEKLEDVLLSPDEVLLNLPVLIVNEEGLDKIRNGSSICIKHISGVLKKGKEESNEEKLIFLSDSSGIIIALARSNKEEGKIFMEKVFI
ncbi:MAG: tRNA pseudouridine(55) synthase TruB [Candidatus Eremiobacteraeota bacterium]|nr:tRNA pseudouridine(55) synthase TruB [Candidatus Eremiobacteraeota bacterium]